MLWFDLLRPNGHPNRPARQDTVGELCSAMRIWRSERPQRPPFPVIACGSAWCHLLNANLRTPRNTLGPSDFEEGEDAPGILRFFGPIRRRRHSEKVGIDQPDSCHSAAGLPWHSEVQCELIGMCRVN